jgi:hypothetical protein
MDSAFAARSFVARCLPLVKLESDASAARDVGGWEERDGDVAAAKLRIESMLDLFEVDLEGEIEEGLELSDVVLALGTVCTTIRWGCREMGDLMFCAFFARSA